MKKIFNLLAFFIFVSLSAITGKLSGELISKIVICTTQQNILTSVFSFVLSKRLVGSFFRVSVIYLGAANKTNEKTFNQLMAIDY